VGYIKPVGQHVGMVGSQIVDLDANLMNKVFHVGHRLIDLSPIAIPSGFTENYLLHGDKNQLHQKVLNAYNRASRDKDFMVIEGTGHAGVGSCFDLSNADVAQMLKAPVVIVSSGGVGRPIDEIVLNKALFDACGVPVLGAIINKVLPDKMEKIGKFVRIGLAKKGIDVLGVVPFLPLLSSPTFKQLFDDLKGELICKHVNLNQTVKRVVVAAMPTHTAIDYFKDDALLVTPGNREDILLAAISYSVLSKSPHQGVKGIILTGGIWPNINILKLVERARIPIMLVSDDTYVTAQRINNLIIKIRPGETDKINQVKRLIKENVNIDLLLEKVKAAHAVT
jgi:BioD-like phosphotransacetylase family protein